MTDLVRERDPEAEADTEHLVVGQDARNRRLKFKRWAGFTCALLFIATALTAAFWLPFFFNDSDNRFKVPSKIVVPDQRIFLSLGHQLGGGAGGAGVRDGGAGELVSFVQLESEASVNEVTIQVVEVDFTERMYLNEDDNVFMRKEGTKEPPHHNPDDGDDNGGEDLEEAALVYGTTKTDTGTHVQFRVGRSKRRPIERAQLRLKIVVPLGFTGELTIDGTELHIESGASLAKARFNLLHLTAHTGNFVLDGSSNNGDDGSGGDGGNRGDRGGRRSRRDDDVPVLRVSTLNAQITHAGSITVGPIKSAARGKSFRTRLETQMGDVSLVPIVTMITANKDRPWEYPDEEDLVYYFNPVSHSHGNVYLDVRQGEVDEEEGGDGEEEGYWIGTVLVTAQAEEGSVTGRVDVNDLQLVSINANSYADTILEVSDVFVGDLAVTSSRSRKATILQKEDSETEIQYSHSESSKKLGVKVFPNPNENFSLGNVDVHSSQGSATLIFS
ncbi:hypothetical protein BGX24_001652 [Mortierella sp. AD032]|nr:hypothetical protein BGX24_001652 [Mortierella sp. AD032]